MHQIASKLPPWQILKRGCKGKGLHPSSCRRAYPRQQWKSRWKKFQVQRGLGWGGGVGRMYKRTLRGVRNGQGFWEQSRGLWDGKCTVWRARLTHRYIHRRKKRAKGVFSWGQIPHQRLPKGSETALRWGSVRDSGAGVPKRGPQGPWAFKMKQVKADPRALIGLGLLGGVGSVLLATHQGWGNSRDSRI